MKTLRIHLSTGGVVKKILRKEGLSDLLPLLEEAFKKPKSQRVILGEDYKGNPFYLRVNHIIAVEIDDMDIQDI